MSSLACHQRTKYLYQTYSLNTKGEQQMNKKIRTIKTAYADIVRDDPHTAITQRAIRTAVVNGSIPSRYIGGKYLITVENVINYFAGDAS